MLKANNRLRQRRDIDRVYKRGTYGSAAGLLTVKAASGANRPSRAVVVVSKKIDKRAVVRNRLRRRLLGSLLEIWATVPDGYDIVISVHRDFRAAPSTELTAALTTALRHARVMS
ncbi:ribonuclease P protein component [Candidatus Saccharibacteria bacterium]|nr:ribonuclease P protein component [Candidatus Saccharibacteria bacterium]